MPTHDYFQLYPPPQPDLVEVDGELRDPLEVIDENIKSVDDIEWLTADLRERLRANTPQPEDFNNGHLNITVDKSKLKAASEAAFKDLKTFCNFYQLKEYANYFASSWGFLLTTQNNFSLHCFFANPTRKEHEPTVSPSKQRHRLTLKSGCSFKISCSPRQADRKNKVKRHRVPVKITTVCFEHGPNCNPSVRTQRLAKQAAGAYVGKLHVEKLGNFVSVVGCGGVSNGLVRKLLKPYIPEGVEISCHDCSNIKSRAEKLHLEGKPLENEDAKKLLGCIPLDEKEEIINIETDISQARTKEFLRTILQQTDEGWKVMAFLEKLRKENKFFDYRMKYDDDGRPTAVVWITKAMKVAWIRFGHTMRLKGH
jgi:hypothetical protein